MKKRILSVVLSAAMAFVGIGAGVWEPVTVYAEETGESNELNGGTEVNPEDNETEGTDDASNEETAEDPKFCGIFIDENGDLNPWEGTDEGNPQPISGNDNDRYFKITETDAEVRFQDVTIDTEEGIQVPEAYNFHYDSQKHILTLKDMNVSIGEGPVITSEYGKNEGQVLKINLIGNNHLTTTASRDAIYLNGSTIITGGALEVNGGVVGTSEDGETFCPSAISVGSGCAILTNYANITTNVTSEGAIGFAAGNLAYGSQSFVDEKGEKQTATGQLINFGTISGKIDLFGEMCEGLVSCRTEYPDPPQDGRKYIGKAYYFTDEDLYPNNMLGNLNEGAWRVVGRYNDDGTPIPSKVWYQWIYTDCEGSVYTEDREAPIQYLVYAENPEALLGQYDVAAVDDGKEHTFNTSLYAVWLTNGNVTVNGNVILDVACSSAPQEEWKNQNELASMLTEWDKTHSLGEYPNGHYGEDIGAVCYVKDDNGNVLFQDSSKSSITINGSTGFLSLSDSYQGSVTVRDDINFCATYAEKDFLKQWIHRLQWQYDGSPYRPAETYYCAVPKAGTVVVGGQFTDKVKNLALAENIKLKGQGLYEGTYFSQTETMMPTGAETEEAVAGTSAVINDNTLLVNVSKKGNLEENTYPLVRKVSDAAITEIREALPVTAGAVAMAMDIAMIQKTYETEDGEEVLTGQKEVEPGESVNLYFDKIDLSKWKNPVLYHITDDGTAEAIPFTYDTAKKHIQCATDSFSQYVFAGEPVIEENPSGGNTTDNPGGGTSSGGTNTGSSGGGASSGGTTSKPTTETKPDGTKVETSTETKSDGTKVDTTVETKTDGTKTETVVETAKDGSVKTTETVTKADGSATKTEKEKETNAQGKEVAVTTTTEKDASGKVTGITQTSEIDQISGSASATVTVEKTADGKITSAEAEVDKKGASSKQGVTATLFGSVVSQITEAAGTQSVEISMTVTAGKKEYTVKADAQDLEAGNKLKVLAIDEKTGKHVLVNAKTYTVSESGNVKLTLPSGMTYQLMDSKEAAAVEKQILATVKVKKATATVAAGKKTTVQMSKKLDMNNVAKITYSTSKKSVATVSKDGQVTAKKTGAVVITAKVTLKNGKTKNVKMKITVE